MPDCDGVHKPHVSHCDYAEQAAEQAVKKTFAILGVDIDKPEQVEEFRQSLRFGDKLRKAADKSFIVFLSALVAALVAACWQGIKLNLK